MAAMPEEVQDRHGLLDVADPEPFSSSVFLDLPPTPPVTTALSSDANATWQCDPVELSQLSSPRRSPSTIDHDGDMLNLAFLKGMEEGNKFLPANNSLLIDNTSQLKKDAMTKFQASVNVKNRRNQDDLEDEMGRNSKLMVSEPEETGEMVDKIILNGFNSCLRGMKGLRITMDGKVHKNTGKKNGKSGKGEVMGDLYTLLIHCAEAVGTDDRKSATQLLGQIKLEALLAKGRCRSE
ncbi:hypothetical protein BAE44_0024426, partial [Dichanthelium oligosanthes]